jgi:hypothetical protein
MGAISSHQQQELLDRLMSAGGMLPEGMEALVSLAAKQAEKAEELSSLRSQVGGVIGHGVVKVDRET